MAIKPINRTFLPSFGEFGYSTTAGAKPAYTSTTSLSSDSSDYLFDTAGDEVVTSAGCDIFNQSSDTMTAGDVTAGDGDDLLVGSFPTSDFYWNFAGAGGAFSQAAGGGKKDGKVEAMAGKGGGILGDVYFKVALDRAPKEHRREVQIFLMIYIATGRTPLNALLNIEGDYLKRIAGNMRAFFSEEELTRLAAIHEPSEVLDAVLKMINDGNTTIPYDKKNFPNTILFSSYILFYLGQFGHNRMDMLSPDAVRYLRYLLMNQDISVLKDFSGLIVRHLHLDDVLAEKFRETGQRQFERGLNRNFWMMMDELLNRGIAYLHAIFDIDQRDRMIAGTALVNLVDPDRQLNAETRRRIGTAAEDLFSAEEMDMILLTDRPFPETMKGFFKEDALLSPSRIIWTAASIRVLKKAALKKIMSDDLNLAGGLFTLRSYFMSPAVFSDEWLESFAGIDPADPQLGDIVEMRLASVTASRDKKEAVDGILSVFDLQGKKSPIETLLYHLPENLLVELRRLIREDFAGAYAIIRNLGEYGRVAVEPPQAENDSIGKEPAGDIDTLMDGEVMPDGSHGGGLANAFERTYAVKLNEKGRGLLKSAVLSAPATAYAAILKMQSPLTRLAAFTAIDAVRPFDIIKGQETKGETNGGFGGGGSGTGGGGMSSTGWKGGSGFNIWNPILPPAEAMPAALGIQFGIQTLFFAIGSFIGLLARLPSGRRIEDGPNYVHSFADGTVVRAKKGEDSSLGQNMLELAGESQPVRSGARLIFSELGNQKRIEQAAGHVVSFLKSFSTKIPPPDWTDYRTNARHIIASFEAVAELSYDVQGRLLGKILELWGKNEIGLEMTLNAANDAVSLPIEDGHQKTADEFASYPGYIWRVIGGRDGRPAHVTKEPTAAPIRGRRAPAGYRPSPMPAASGSKKEKKAKLPPSIRPDAYAAVADDLLTIPTYVELASKSPKALAEAYKVHFNNDKASLRIVHYVIPLLVKKGIRSEGGLWDEDLRLAVREAEAFGIPPLWTEMWKAILRSKKPLPPTTDDIVSVILYLPESETETLREMLANELKKALVMRLFQPFMPDNSDEVADNNGVNREEGINDH